MKKTGLMVMLVTTLFACERTENSGNVSNSDPIGELNLKALEEDFSLENLQFRMGKVASFHNEMLVQYYDTHDILPDNFEEEMKAFSWESTIGVQNDLCEGYEYSDEIAWIESADGNNENWLEELQFEVGITFSEEFKDACHKIDKVLSQNGSVKKVSVLLDKTVNKSFDQLNDEIEKMALVAFAEVGKASFTYWKENLNHWSKKYGSGMIKADDPGQNIARADGRGAIKGAVKGGIAGYALGPGGMFASSILGSAFNALTSSLTQVGKEYANGNL